MAQIVVKLRTDERTALRILARREMREPQAQAALLIRAELERYGLLATEAPQLAKLAQPAGEMAHVQQQ